MRRSPRGSDAGRVTTSTKNVSLAGRRPRRSSTVSTDGTRICWITKGQGKPLILVHGAVADHTRLEPFADLLADRFAVHLVDRRGRGMSGDGHTYDIELEYDDIAAVAKAIGQGVTLLGHSYGGPIVIGAATRTDAIARVIAYEGWPSVPGSPPLYEIGDTAERIQVLLDAGDRDGAVSVVFRDLLGLDAAQLEGMRAQRSWKARLAAATTLPRELRTEPTIQLAAADLAAVEVPVLLVIGGQNESALRPGADQLCSLMRDARVRVLPGQGHMAFDTGPDLLASAITAFVEATKPASP
jgi:pimeloyl-ACP methyl ester carboxylesterase